MIKKRKKNKILPFFKGLAFLLFLITFIVLMLFKKLDVLPNKYYVLLSIVLGVVTVVLSSLVLIRRGTKIRIVSTFISFVYILILCFAAFNSFKTINFLKKIGFSNYKTENYSILVLKENDFKNIKDLDGKNIGILNFKTEGLIESKKKLDKLIDYEKKEYDDVSLLKNDFLNENVDSMLIENSMLSILIEDDALFENSYDVIYEFSINIKTKNIVKSVDITKDSFNIYVSGIDTYGVVSSVSRSDVNMVLTVNPKTNKILVTSIPRDYYIDLAEKEGKDKLTHAGIYGVETSVGSIENLLDIKINYYVKVNFSSVIKVVDALDGVSLYSNYDFTSRDGYTYKKGYNNVNGEEALSFVRERKAFTGGDRVRIENQALLIKAIINKGLSSTIITKYSALLNSLQNTFVTNLDMNDLTKFIKAQIDKPASWQIDSYSLDGSDGLEYTYSYKASKLYVMLPNYETVVNAKNKILEVYN